MPYIAHTDLLFKILKFQDVYEFHSILFMSKFEINTLSASFNNMFTQKLDILYIHTRDNSPTLTSINNNNKIFDNLTNFAFPKLE